METNLVGMNRESVGERLLRYPEIMARMERLLDVVENVSGDVKKADEAERRAIEEIRQMGLEVMQSWGQKASRNAALELEERGGVTRDVKKKLHWLCTFGEVTVEEQIYRMKESGKSCRPFQAQAAVDCRGYSLQLQRAITDFGADVSFEHVPEKIREHYGIAIAKGSAATITEHHAKNLKTTDMTPKTRLTHSALTLIAEIDGSMIPMVRTGIVGDGTDDRRKTREIFWKEAKLSLVRRSDEVSPIFAVTLGDAEAAGADLMRLAVAAGFNKRGHVHGLGDGAPWISDQMERQFGRQCTFHVDFYHVCDYLAAAGKVCAANEPSWMGVQKDRLKSGQLSVVMTTLAPFQEPETVPAEQAPVRVCYRYLENRKDQLNYQAALAADLPIGSGEVESAHRYIIQKRLKLPGAWWNPENAQAMLNLRVTRANRGWNQYWDKIAA